jgi:hypothetical protein
MLSRSSGVRADSTSLLVAATAAACHAVLTSAQEARRSFWVDQCQHLDQQFMREREHTCRAGGVAVRTAGDGAYQVPWKHKSAKKRSTG